jgi:hypothetical protein
MPWINFNTDRTPNFLWPKYLEFTKTRAAPAKLFEEGGFPERPNSFRPGMKLEGFDPRMQSQFIVLSVVATKGNHTFLFSWNYSVTVVGRSVSIICCLIQASV